MKINIKGITISYLIIVYLTVIWVVYNCYGAVESVEVILGPGSVVAAVYGVIPITIAYIVTMIVLFTKIKEINQGDSLIMQELNFCMLLMKCGMILYFLVIFACYAMLTLFLGALFGIVGFLPMIAGVIVSGCTLFMTSSYCIVIFILFYRQGYFTGKTLTLYILSQLVFCLDVVMVIVAYKYIKGRLKEDELNTRLGPVGE